MTSAATACTRRGVSHTLPTQKGGERIQCRLEILQEVAHLCRHQRLQIRRRVRQRKPHVHAYTLSQQQIRLLLETLVERGVDVGLAYDFAEAKQRRTTRDLSSVVLPFAREHVAAHCQMLLPLVRERVVVLLRCLKLARLNANLPFLLFEFNIFPHFRTEADAEAVVAQRADSELLFNVRVDERVVHRPDDVFDPEHDRRLSSSAAADDEEATLPIVQLLWAEEEATQVNQQPLHRLWRKPLRRDQTVKGRCLDIHRIEAFRDTLRRRAVAELGVEVVDAHHVARGHGVRGLHPTCHCHLLRILDPPALLHPVKEEEVVTYVVDPIVERKVVTAPHVHLGKLGLLRMHEVLDDLLRVVRRVREALPNVKGRRFLLQRPHLVLDRVHLAEGDGAVPLAGVDAHAAELAAFAVLLDEDLFQNVEQQCLKVGELVRVVIVKLFLLHHLGRDAVTARALHPVVHDEGLDAHAVRTSKDALDVRHHVHQLSVVVEHVELVTYAQSCCTGTCAGCAGHSRRCT